MNNYETNIIIKPTLALNQVKKLVEKLVKMIKKDKGSIVHQPASEMRPLAYPIQKHEKGYYQVLEFQAPPSFVESLETFYKREEDILRYITIALNKHAVAYNENKRKSKKKSSQNTTSSKEETTRSSSQEKK